MKAVRLIVPYAPGGGADAVARLVTPRLSDALGQQVVVDNRPGAASNIGNELAARAPADGYTLLMGAAALAINVSLYRQLSYSPLKDFAPIGLIAASPNIVVTHPSLPAKSIKELIALARANPGKINYASGGSGTTPHLGMELFKVMARVDLAHIPYKSAGPALVALLGGEIPLSMLSPLAALTHVKTGRLRALAITSARRSEAIPDLPTVAESGLQGFEATQWYGVLAPAGTPDAVIARVNAALIKVVDSPEIRSSLTREGAIILAGTPAAFADYLRSEIPKWERVVKFSGARAE